MAPHGLWRKVRRKFQSQVRDQIGRLSARWQGADLTDQALLKALKGDYADLSPFLRDLEANHQERYFPHLRHPQQLHTALNSLSPQAEERTVKAAGQVCAHVFDLLGSGPTTLGEKIDWHTDFKSGHRFDPKSYYKDVRAASYPGGFDIKVPWELSRCQHFVWLGQAYTFTGNDKYAQEFVAQTTDWIASNPWPLGVNWTCTMDVAIRAVNWLWGYAFFKESPSLSDEFRLLFTKSLLIHGRHIDANLENQGEVPGNHYLANLVGLLYLGFLCPEFKEAQRWREFGAQELESQIFKQVYADGVNFEASTSYHRLVLEMFLSATILARRSGHTFSLEYMERLEKMAEFVLCLTGPDGTAPLIGDNDNGRLHRLKVWEPPEREWTDFRYLLAIAAILFKRNDFALAAGDQWEEALWLFGEEALTFHCELAAQHLPPLQLSSRAFADAGYYITRSDSNYLVVDVGSVGRNGSGGHAHNDTLSVEIFAHGQRWIVDPGAYLYTADYVARNHFRSTASHNTVMIGSEEQNRFRTERGRLFGLHNEDAPKVYAWHSNEQYDFISMAHTGFKGLAHPVEHQRQIYFHKERGSWVIRDLITAPPGCDIEWFWHFSPSITLSIKESAAVATNAMGHSLHMTIQGKSSNIRLDQEMGFISPGYGLRSEAPILRCTTKSEGVTEVAFCILPTGNRPKGNGAQGEKVDVEPIWRAFGEVLVSHESEVQIKNRKRIAPEYDA